MFKAGVNSLSILKDRRFRNTGFQVAFVGALVLLVVTFIITARTNLEAQGLTSGFKFLERATGWSISFSLLEYKISDPYSRAILIGFLNSMFVGAISLTVATFIGLAIGVMRTSSNAMARLLGVIYVEVFRNVPLLLQLFLWYAILIALPSPRNAIALLGDRVFITGRGVFMPGWNVEGGMIFAAILAFIVAFSISLWLKHTRRFPSTFDEKKKLIIRGLYLGAFILAVILIWSGRFPDTDFISMPYLKGLNFGNGLRVSPELAACIIAISVYGGAYIAEIIRAGYNSVSKGQSEAGHALGLTQWQTFSRIILPLAIRAVLPTLINQYVWLLKATTIGIAIGFVDFFMVISISINQSGQTLELIGILMAGFLMVNYTMSWVLNRVNNMIKLKGTQIQA